MPSRRLLLSAVLLGLLAPASASASPGQGPTAAVSLGDSYISGEAGRWQGNSVSPTPGNDGTDRACTGGPPCTVDESRVYVGGTDTNGCHRSDVAEILTASLPVDERVNLACSGGVTKNIFRAASGGEGQNGELPQADQLLPVAKAKNVKLVQLSIGGNDLGFASIVGACLTAYTTRGTPCSISEQPKLDAAKPKARADIEKAIDEIRAVMSEAGYAAGDYRLIVQTYPSVVPRAAESRYGENDPLRANVCPFLDVDLDWGRDQAGRQIGDVVKAAARAKGTEILELADAFQGREFCSKTTRLADPLTPPSATTSEWGRFLGASVVQQGKLQETFHPNAYGQAAFASCLGRAFAMAPGTFDCRNTPGQAPDAMVVSRTGTIGGTVPVPGVGGGTRNGATKKAARLRLGILRTYRRGSRTCVRFSVRAGGKAVRGARVRLAAQHGLSRTNGRLVLCAKLRRGSATAVAKRKGLRQSPTRRVRARR